MLSRVLVRASRNRIGIVVTENAEVRTRLRPNVVGLGRMNAGIVPAGSRENVMVGRGVGNLLADIDYGAVNERSGSSVHQTVNEWGVRILENLLGRTVELVVWLGPIMIFHSDDEHFLDALSAGALDDQYREDGRKHEHVRNSAKGHLNL